VHVPGSDRSEEAPGATVADRESHEKRSAVAISPHGDKPPFVGGMSRIGSYTGLITQDRLDLLDGDPMCLTFRAVASIPIEPVEDEFHLDILRAGDNPRRKTWPG